jgi:hypothetical protein
LRSKSHKIFTRQQTLPRRWSKSNTLAVKAFAIQRVFLLHTAELSCPPQKIFYLLFHKTMLVVEIENKRLSFLGNIPFLFNTGILVVINVVALLSFIAFTY